MIRRILIAWHRRRLRAARLGRFSLAANALETHMRGDAAEIAQLMRLRDVAHEREARHRRALEALR